MTHSACRTTCATDVASGPQPLNHAQPNYPVNAYVAFHLASDHWRVCQLKLINGITIQPLSTFDEWALLKSRGEKVVKERIRQEIESRSCLIVFIGPQTSDSTLVNFAVETAAELNKPVIGVYGHGLRNMGGATSPRGAPPPAFAKLPRHLTSVVDPDVEGGPNAVFLTISRFLPEAARRLTDLN